MAVSSSTKRSLGFVSIYLYYSTIILADSFTIVSVEWLYRTIKQQSQKLFEMDRDGSREKEKRFYRHIFKGQTLTAGIPEGWILLPDESKLEDFLPVC